MDAVIYCRLSMERSSEFSLENQEARCRVWAAANGHRVLRVYADDGESGTKVTRTAFMKMRRELQGLGVRLLIVYDLDRFMRNLREQLNLKHELDQRRVTLVSLSDNGIIDTSTPEGMLNFQVKGMVSEFQARTTGRKVHDTLEHKAKQGQWVGPLPFGYVRDGKTLAPHPTHAAVVTQIFAWYATGQWSYTRIVERLNAEGVVFVHWRDGERPFSRESVRSILGNPAYRGIVTCNAQQLPGQHPPLISDTLWFDCAAVRKRRDQSTGCSATERGAGGLLSDIARCAICKAPMWYHRSGPRESRRFFYRCSTRARLGKSGCDASLISVQRAEDHALAVLRALTIPAPLHAVIIERAKQLILQPPPVEQAFDRARIERQLERLKKAYLAGDEDLTDTVYQAERARLQALLQMNPPAPPMMLDVQRAVTVLSDMPQLLEGAESLHRRSLVQRVFTHVWLNHEAGIKAITPSPGFVQLVEVMREVGLGCPMGCGASI